MLRKLLSCVIVGAFAGILPAQPIEELKAALDAMGRRVASLETHVDTLSTENSRLKGALASVEAVAEEAEERALSQQIAAVAERSFDGITVNSVANPITFLGEFRTRIYAAFGENNELVATVPFSVEHTGYYADSLLRIGLLYEFDRNISAYAEMQAHWAFGDGAPTSRGLSLNGGILQSANEPTTFVRVHQAWTQIGTLFGAEGLSLRLGRQEIILGRQFHVGNSDWFNGFSFDAALVRYADPDFEVNAFGAKLASTDRDFNQLPSYFNSHDDDELYSIYFTLRAIENVEIDAYWIYINGHGSAPFGSGPSSGSHVLTPVVGGPFGGTAYYHTVGLRFAGLFPDVAAGFDWNLEGSYQFGDADRPVPGPAPTLETIDVDSFTVEAEFGLTLDSESLFRVYIRFLYAGRDFIPLYGNRHSHENFRARYGIHDLFPMTNVITGQLGFHFDPGPQWTVGATGIWATADSSPGVIPNEDYGFELDFWASYRFTEHLVFSTGLALAFADEALILTDDETQVLFYFEAQLLF